MTYKGLDEPTAVRLLESASQAREYATPKRTGFRVGAALLAENGEMITGCNMELASFLTGICAERCAMAKALSMGYRRFRAIAIVGDGEEAIAPCGICRQFLLDLGLDLVVLMANRDQSLVREMTTQELLPAAFLGPHRNVDKEEICKEEI